MKKEYIVGLVIIVLVAVAVGTLFLSSSDNTKDNMLDLLKSKNNGTPFIEIVNPSGFVNTNDRPIKIGDYVGKKVILLDIMTYSCINCQRTFPYVIAWYEKYKDDGLIVIGIHTPEFAFEKDKGNVEEAMAKLGIKFPVVLDNDYSTWNAYKNSYWPRKYLIDINGNIVYDHIGEGAYEETEMKIKELLQERAKVLGESDNLESDLAASNINEVAILTKSPETYFGALRNEYLGNGLAGKFGLQTFVLPTNLKLNKLYLEGKWKIFDERAESEGEGKIVYKYNAKEVYLVASSKDGVEVEVWQDGKLVTTEAGADVTFGKVTFSSSRLYKLIKNTEPGEHVLELKVKKGTMEVYAFTFG